MRDSNPEPFQLNAFPLEPPPLPALTFLIFFLEPEEAKPEPEVTVGDQIRLEHAAHEIDTSAGFQPKSFVSSASHKRLVKEAQRLNNVGNGAGGDDKGDSFQFGTSVDKNSAFLAKLNEEGLCHPNLYADTKRREQKYLKNLRELRKKLRQNS